MGGWATRTRRKFIWSEIRIEVTFSTPRITIGFQSEEVLHSRNEEAYFVAMVMTHSQTPKSSALYRLKEVSRDGRESEMSKWYKIEDKPWFLSAETTIPEAKCPWLNFVEDVASTNLKVTMTETRSSYDFVPEGFQRPVASMDGSSFLTVMSLFGIHWAKKGVDGTFAGIADSGSCEISSVNIFNFGNVYLYRRTPQLGRRVEQSIPDLNHTRYYISSERARRAMFNCFELGFTTIRTHDTTELRDSLLRLRIHDDKVRNFVKFFDDRGGWCPGVRDAIGCWATASLPKMVTKTNDKDGQKYEFKSVFSGCSATPLMGDSPFAAMLLGGDHYLSHYKERFDSVDSIRNLTEWAKGYLASLPHVTKSLLHSCLTWIASQQGNVMTDFIIIPYAQSVECLKGILSLDDHLDTHLLSNFRSKDKQELKSSFCSEQIQCQYEFVSDMDNAHSEYGRGRHRPWYFEGDRVGSAYYCQLARKIASSFELDSTLAQEVVVNRLMRASLWSVHNGNAPNFSQRSLECSLSSRWLQQNFTVYVS